MLGSREELKVYVWKRLIYVLIFDFGILSSILFISREEANVVDNCFYVKDFVDSKFAIGAARDSEKIAEEFMKRLRGEFDDKEFADLLIVSGFIPDLYDNDSSEETLFSKMIEALVAEWARRMGFKSSLIRQKSSYEDVLITIDCSSIVCDAKSFRLGRSQKAPNVKDFLKPEDMRNWMTKYTNAIGGLVTYPCTHEWKKTSDVFVHCSDKDTPVVILPYKYLAFTLEYKERYSTDSLIGLWDYSSIFPNKLPKNCKGGNVAAYWETMNKAITDITKTDEQDLKKFMKTADGHIQEAVDEHIKFLNQIVKEREVRVRQAFENYDDIDKLRKDIIRMNIEKETANLRTLIKRIKSFRKIQT